MLGRLAGESVYSLISFPRIHCRVIDGQKFGGDSRSILRVWIESGVLDRESCNPRKEAPDRAVVALVLGRKMFMKQVGTAREVRRFVTIGCNRAVRACPTAGSNSYV